MATYYVSVNGNDSGSGTASSPFRTINRALDLQLGGGDTIVVKPGTYNESITFDKGGDASGNVTLKSEIPGAALIRPPSGAWNAFYVWDDHITIDGFDIQGGDGDGIEANNVHHISVLNNIIHDAGESGIQFNRSEFITIEGNTTYNNASDGWFSGISIYQTRNITGDTSTQGFRTIVRNNISYDNVTKSGAHTDGNGIIIDDFQSTQTGGHPNYTFPTLVENNLVYNNGGKGIAVHWSDNVTVRNNTAWHNNLDLQNSGTWRGELSNHEGRNNVWVNNIAVADPTVNASNTAVGNYSPSAYPNTGTVWKNNLTFNGKPGDASVNLDGGNAPLTAANGNLLGVDPRFLQPGSNFELSPDSPAVNAGTAAHGLGRDDLDGGPRAVGTVDLGSYETDSAGGSQLQARADSVRTGEDSTIVIDVLANDDSGTAAHAALTVQSLDRTGTTGRVVINADSDVVYDPRGRFDHLADGEALVDTFSYQVADGRGGTDVATVRVRVEGVNDAPNAARDRGIDAVADNQLRLSAGTLLRNDDDPESQALTISSVSDADNGTVRLGASGNVLFTPDAAGKASFRYTVSDGHGGTDMAKVVLDVTSAALKADAALFGGENGSAAQTVTIADSSDLATELEDGSGATSARILERRTLDLGHLAFEDAGPAALFGTHGADHILF